MTRLLGTYITNPLLTPDSNEPTTYPRASYSMEYDQAYTWAQDWAVYLDTDATGGGNGQFRDIAVTLDGTKVVCCGGQVPGSWVDGPTDNLYTVVGGTAGSGTPHDTIVFCFDTSDGSILWSTSIGADGNYDRSYALEIIGNTVIVAGRGGALFPTTSGAAIETFQGDSNPNGFYGPQNATLLRLDLATGERLASTYNEPTANGGGYNRDVDVDNLGNVYVSVNRYGSGSPIVGQRVMKISPTLNSITDVVQIGPVSAKLGGEPSLRVTADNQSIYAMIGTDVAAPLGADAGAWLPTIPVSTAHSAYIIKLAAADLSYEAATYLHHDAALNMNIETHGLQILPNGWISVTHQSGTGTFSVNPVTADYVYGSAVTGQNIVLTVLTADLTDVVFCTHLHTNDAAESKALDSQSVGPGGRIASVLTTDSTSFQTADGSTNSGGDRVGFWILAPLVTGEFWLEFAALVDDVSSGDGRAIGWAPNGDLYVGGASNNNPTGGSGPFLAKYTRSTVTPSFSKTAGVAARFRSPDNMTTMGVSAKMTVEIKQLRLDLAAAMTIIDTTSGLWKVVVQTSGAISIRGNGTTGAITSATGIITAGATHDYVFTVDGSDVAHVYLDGSSTPAVSSTSGANATGTDQLFYMAGAACGITTCGQITMWDDVNPTAGDVPTGTPLKILRGYGRTLNHNSWKIDAGLFT